MKQGTIYACLDTGLTSDASSHRSVLKVNKARYQITF